MATSATSIGQPPCSEASGDGLSPSLSLSLDLSLRRGLALALALAWAFRVCAPETIRTPNKGL